MAHYGICAAPLSSRRCKHGRRLKITLGIAGRIAAVFVSALGILYAAGEYPVANSVVPPHRRSCSSLGNTMAEATAYAPVAKPVRQCARQQWLTSITTTHSLRGFLPHVAMVKTTDTRQPHPLCVRRRSSFNGTPLRYISNDRVNTLRIVVADIVTEESAQVILIEHEHVIDDLSLA